MILTSSKLWTYVMNSFENEIPIFSCSIVIFKKKSIIKLLKM